MTTWQAVLTICGLALVTLLTRAFFLIPQREVPLPGRLQQGLRRAACRAARDRRARNRDEAWPLDRDVAGCEAVRGGLGW